jgi:hypothetical protein
MAGPHVTADRLRECLTYNPDTGLFTRRIRTGHRVKVGDPLGTLRPDGYLKASLLGINYLLHRLAWLHVYGEWPTFVIDHINGVRTDNRIANLRDVPETVNQQNQRRAHRKNKSCGLLGVTWHPRNRKWQAQIGICGGRVKYIGSYDDAEDAHAAYLEAKRRLHEGCTI